MRQRLIGWGLGCLALLGMSGGPALAQAPKGLVWPGGLLTGKTIVIDPGHGGFDPGAFGPTAREDTVNLAVALDLARWFRAAGAKTVLTWSSPSDIPKNKKYRVNDRVPAINRTGADMLIDIHCNAGASSWSGPQTFYWDGVSSYYLARDVQQELRYATHTKRDIKRINQYVLRYANMPAINVEVGFITNPREAHLLLTQAYQDKLSVAILIGVERWLLQGPWSSQDTAVRLPRELVQR